MKKLIYIAAALCAATVFVISASAQKKTFRAGEQIECKTSYSKDEWGPCTFVEQSYDGTQPVIKDAQGFQKALPNWDWVRSAAPAPVVTPAADNDDDEPNIAAPQGEGLMSQADIINFLKTSLGPDPFASPRQSAVKTQLAEEIKRRGLSFHFDPLSPFFNQASKYTGMDSELTGPLHDNYGPPTAQSWLMGSWRLDVVGATTLYEKNGDLYRKEASAAGNIGRLTINPDGSYLWKANAPVATFRGRWRKATPAEMMSQGGEGIVLLNAKNGWNWIVTQLRGSTVLKGDVIYVSYINGRGVREIGSR
jgi:hypothetical protein